MLSLKSPPGHHRRGLPVLLPSEIIPQGQPPNPVIGFFIQFWWLIPVALVVSAACGIWFEQSRRQRRESLSAPVTSRDSRNATVVQKPGGTTLPGQPGHGYAVRLPAALEKNTRTRNISPKVGSRGSSGFVTKRTTVMQR